MRVGICVNSEVKKKIKNKHNQLGNKETIRDTRNPWLVNRR